MPTGDHVAAHIEAVEGVVDLDDLILGVGAVAEVEPPADGILLPGGERALVGAGLVCGGVVGLVSGRSLVGSLILGGIGGGIGGGDGDLGGSRGVGQLGGVGGNDGSGENGSADGGDHERAGIDGTHLWVPLRCGGRHRMQLSGRPNG